MKILHDGLEEVDGETIVSKAGAFTREGVRWSFAVGRDPEEAKQGISVVAEYKEGDQCKGFVVHGLSKADVYDVVTDLLEDYCTACAQ